VAKGAADLARKLVLDGLLGRVVPLEVMVAVGEVDVILVEDSGPLEGCGCGVLVPRQDTWDYTTYRAESDRSCNGIACCPEAPVG
jgi:hypothetical protein